MKLTASLLALWLASSLVATTAFAVWVRLGGHGGVALAGDRGVLGPRPDGAARLARPDRRRLTVRPYGVDAQRRARAGRPLEVRAYDVEPPPRGRPSRISPVRRRAG